MQRREVDKDTEWFDKANCKGRTELFFADQFERPIETRKKERIAAAICAACPVSDECKAYARRNGEHGFWGGESEDQRFATGYLKDPVLIRRDRARRSRLLKNLQD